MPGRRPTWRRPSGQGASPQQRRLSRARLPRSKSRVVGLVPQGGTKVNNARPFPTGCRGAALSDAGVSRGRYLGSVVRLLCLSDLVTLVLSQNRFTRIKNRRFDWRRYGFGLIAVKKYQLFDFYDKSKLSLYKSPLFTTANILCKILFLTAFNTLILFFPSEIFRR